MAWLKVTQIAQNTFGSGFMVNGCFNLDASFSISRTNRMECPY